MIAAWNNSLQYDTALLETNFNLARYYYAHADTEKAEAYLRQASIKGGYVVDLNDMANKYDIFYLAYAPLTPQQVGAADKIEAYYVHEFLAPQLWQYLARGKRVVFILAAFGLWLLGFAITTFAKVRPASICQRCGDPACQKCQPELPDQKICEKCYRQAAQGGESARRHHHQYGVKSKKLRSGLIMTIIAVSFVTAGWLMAAGKNDPLLSQVVFSGSEAAWRPYREVFLQESLAGGQKVALSQALEAYYLTFGHYPLKLAELAESGFVSEVDLRWPWRAEYAYERYFVEKQQSLLNKQPPASWRLLTPVDNFQP